MTESNINSLANSIVKFGEGYDYYDFYDNYNSIGEAYEVVKKDLMTGQIENYIESFIDIIECNAYEKNMNDEDINKQTTEALNIIKQLNKFLFDYKKSLEDEIGIN